MSNKTVAVIFGGACVEHEISLISSKSIISNLDRSKFDIFAIFISKQGNWHKAEVDQWLDGGELVIDQSSEITPSLRINAPGHFLEIKNSSVVNKVNVDIIFPVLHGTYGEDGSVQGLFELMNIPYIGAGVLGSSVGMDKIVMKDVLKNAGISVVDYLGFNSSEWNENKEEILKSITETISFPAFVKSADLGSSVGVYKIFSESEVEKAVDSSFKFSNRVIVEKAVDNIRELEVSLLGNESPIASLPGEIIPKKDFYDYEAKYHDDSTELVIPAKLNENLIEKLKDISIKTYTSLCCSGMGRIDFLMDSKTEEIYVSEINTIPGFTSISMYPKLWEISGISYKDLLTRLIELAEERFESKKKIETDFSEK